MTRVVPKTHPQSAKRLTVTEQALRFTLLHWVMAALAVLPAAGFADGNALLMRMNQAFSDLDYDGVFTYASGGDLTALRVVHKIVDGTQRERLIHLNGAPREIIRHGEDVVCVVTPGDDIAVLEQAIPAGPFARAFVREFERLTDSYRVDTMGEGRVAGRSAVRVAVSPLDQHRYGFRLWLDAENSLLLRSELVDHDGERLEVFQFSQVRFGDEVAAEALESEEISGSMVSHLTLKAPTAVDQGEADGTPQSWSVGWLPQGFKMAAQDLRRRPADAQDVTSMVYSDGLATFSIFIESMPEQGAAPMISQSGATVAITQGVQAFGRFYLVTLVGEIPSATGRKVLTSLAGV